MTEKSIDVEDLARNEDSVLFHPLKLTKEDEMAISEGYYCKIEIPTLLFASVSSTEMISIGNNGDKMKSFKRDYGIPSSVTIENEWGNHVYVVDSYENFRRNIRNQFQNITRRVLDSRVIKASEVPKLWELRNKANARLQKFAIVLESNRKIIDAYLEQISQKNKKVIKELPMDLDKKLKVTLTFHEISFSTGLFKKVADKEFQDQYKAQLKQENEKIKGEIIADTRKKVGELLGTIAQTVQSFQESQKKNSKRKRIDSRFIKNIKRKMQTIQQTKLIDDPVISGSLKSIDVLTQQMERIGNSTPKKIKNTPIQNEVEAIMTMEQALEDITGIENKKAPITQDDSNKEERMTDAFEELAAHLKTESEMFQKESVHGDKKENIVKTNLAEADDSLSKGLEAVAGLFSN